MGGQTIEGIASKKPGQSILPMEVAEQIAQSSRVDRNR